MSGVNEAVVYSDYVRNLLNRRSSNLEFSVVYMRADRLTGIDVSRYMLRNGFDFRYTTREFASKQVVAFVKALRASNIQRLPLSEIKDTSFDLRYAVTIAEFNGRTLFALYLTGNECYGYVDDIHVSIAGPVVNWFKDFARKLSTL